MPKGGIREKEEKVNHHENPAQLSRAIGKASKLVKSVSYDFPGVWYIDTAKASYLLGNMHGEFAWHNEEGTISSDLPDLDEFTAPEVVAVTFAKWLEKEEAN